MAPTVQTITSFAGTMTLRGVTPREASFKNFTVAFRNVTAALLSLSYRAVKVTSVATALPSYSARDWEPAAEAGGRVDESSRLHDLVSRRLAAFRPGVNARMPIPIDAQGTINTYTAVSYSVSTVNQRTADFAVVLAFAVKTGQVGAALATSLKMPGLQALAVTVTDTSPTPSPTSAAPVAETTNVPTVASAAPTLAPTNLIDAVSTISTGLLVGVVVGGGALCCCAVLFLMTADEYDWCGVRERLLAQNTTSPSAMATLTETVPLAQARPVSPGPMVTRPKLSMGLTGSPKGKAQFKGTVGRVHVA
jgi:hypothetical protein